MPSYIDSRLPAGKSEFLSALESREYCPKLVFKNAVGKKPAGEREVPLHHFASVLVVSEYPFCFFYDLVRDKTVQSDNVKSSGLDIGLINGIAIADHGPPVIYCLQECVAEALIS